MFCNIQSPSLFRVAERHFSLIEGPGRWLSAARQKGIEGDPPKKKALNPKP